MRICLLSQEYPPETGGGGIGTQTYLKAQGLAERGHTIHVVSSSWDKEEREYSIGNVHIHRVAEPDWNGDPEQSTVLLAYSFAAAGKLHELSASIGFDIVQLPEYCGEGFVFQTDTFARRTAKYVVQLHGPLAMFVEHLGWPEAGSTFQQIGCFMERMVVHRADQIIASSHNTAAFCARYYDLDLDTIKVIHSAIDTDRFVPGPERAKDDECRILFVGNIVGDKGVGLLVDSVLRLKDLKPRVRLRAIGKGSDDEIERLRQKVKANGVADRVEILGYVPYQELPPHYSWCDVFAGPSTFEPGPGNVYLEAMSSGRPVLACNTGGTPEVVLDGTTGVLIPSRDIGALTAALAELASDPARRGTLGRAARDWVKARFSIESYLDRVEAIYLEVLQRGLGNARIQVP